MSMAKLGFEPGTLRTKVEHKSVKLGRRDSRAAKCLNNKLIVSALYDDVAIFLKGQSCLLD